MGVGVYKSANISGGKAGGWGCGPYLFRFEGQLGFNIYPMLARIKLK